MTPEKCYHIFKLSDGGMAYIRWQKCYHTRSAANKAIDRWLTQNPDRDGKRPSGIDYKIPHTRKQFHVEECVAMLCSCPCAFASGGGRRKPPSEHKPRRKAELAAKDREIARLRKELAALRVQIG